MILSDTTIKKKVASGELVITPYSDSAVQPASYDCTLDDHYLRVDDNSMHVITLSNEIIYREVTAKKIIIPAHSFILATTIEYIKLPNDITAFVEGRSSIGRIGLFIQNAGWIDPGFEGKITLELYNANSLPIELESGRRICQFVFCSTTEPAENPYHGKYIGQDKTVGSRIFKDVENKKQ